MPENEEKVGFEAYFETREFEEGIKRFEDGLFDAGKSTDTFIDKIGNLDTELGKMVGRIGGRLAGSALGIPDIGGNIGETIGERLGGIRMLLGLFGPLGVMVGSLIPAFKFLGNAIGGVGKIAGTIAKGAFSIFQIALKGVLFTVGSLAVGIGATLIGSFLSLKNVVSNVANSIIQDLRDTFELVKTMQSIEVGLGAITRAALVMEGEFANATEAWEAAIPITDQLLDKLIEISLTSPFSVEDVNVLFRTISAYGIAIGTSIELTEAMIDLGSATGFSNTILERIGRNFAQIARNGRIFQRDIYELANAGIDLHAVLDTQLNVTVAEMNELLKSGEMNVNDLITALQGFAETYYGGSAEALSKTLEGLENRFKTLKTVLLNDFVQPIIQQALPAIETFFEGIAVVINTGVFEKLGELVAWTMRTIVGDVNWSANSVAEIILEFILWLIQTGDKMMQYGYDMMTEWGYGMLRGAVDAIKAVVQFISSTLTSLFKTASPPAILPLIDVWGAGLIEAWLEGMSSADFGVINDIISPIKDAFELMNLDDDVIYQNLQNIARLMADALETGNLGEGLLGYIADITGPFGDAIAELTSLHFDLAEAIREVEEAQKALDDANKMYKEQDENVRRLVREYNDLLRAGASDDVLDTKLGELNTAIDQREEAEKLIQERERELDAAEDNRDMIQEQVEAQTELVNLMFDLVQGIEDAEDDAGGLAGKIEDAAAAMENLWGGVGDLDLEEIGFSPAIQGLMDDIDKAIMNFKETFRNLFGSLMEELGFEQEIHYDWDTETWKPRWVKTGEGLFAGLGDAFKELAQTVIDINWGELDWSTFINNLSTVIGEKFAQLKENETIKSKARDVGSSIAEAIFQGIIRAILSAYPNWYVERVSNIIESFKMAFGIDGEDSTESKDKVGKPIGQGILSGAWDSIKNSISETVTGIWNSVIGSFKQTFGIEGEESSESKDKVGKPIGEGILSGALKSIIDGISEAVTSIWNSILQSFKNILGIESPSTAASDEIGQPIGEGILVGIVTNIVDNIAETATDVWEEIKEAFSGFYEKAFEIGKDFLQGLLDGISDIGDLGGWASGIIDKLIDALGLAGDTGSPSRKFADEIGVPFAQGVLMGFKDEMSGMKKDMFTAVNSLMNYQPTPTNAYAPSAISTNNITYNMNMGNNVVRDDTDIALIVAANKRAIKQASYRA